MKRPPVIAVQLIHISGPRKGEIQDFAESPITVGRNPDCHVRFPADLSTVSRKHAEIVREGNLFKLQDHSANGTFINGKPVKEATLRDGDVLEFAKGGPKVSFLTQVREEKEEKAPAPVPPREPLPPPPSPEPPRRPPVSSRPPEPEIREIPRPEPPPSPSLREESPIPQTVRVPLMIQFGPTLRSYKQLP
ncbi:MAG TPA: FHA domain-containing protein, partial [Thermodesulfobacteriota bacterium]|nr:FHA domain-containing protein [Thermodesulfobacteriota bacterium]